MVTGFGRHADNPAALDPRPYLSVRKNRKFMGRQDDLAVVAAGKALASAGLSAPGARCGLYLAVGYIPFEEHDIDALYAESGAPGGFSMDRFSTTGLQAVHPLLAFRCLPNMPAFHISVNFDIQGPYLVTYPGPGQFYLALEAACQALADDLVDCALVGGVAHQHNFLVRHHHARLSPPVPEDSLVDAAACLVMEREASATARGGEIRARLADLSLSYEPHRPFEQSARVQEEAFNEVTCAWSTPASLPDRVCVGGVEELHHRLKTRDGIVGGSTWIYR